VSNLVITAKLGCIQRGWQWQIPDDYFGFEIPTDISQNLSKVAVTSVIGESQRVDRVMCSLVPSLLELPSSYQLPATSVSSLSRAPPYDS
jgi:hypothetical protein